MKTLYVWKSNPNPTEGSPVSTLKTPVGEIAIYNEDKLGFMVRGAWFDNGKSYGFNTVRGAQDYTESQINALYRWMKHYLDNQRVLDLEKLLKEM